MIDLAFDWLILLFDLATNWTSILFNETLDEHRNYIEMKKKISLGPGNI